MIQKTYHIHDYTEAKLAGVLDEVAAMPEYGSSSQLLLLMLEQCWDRACIESRIAAVKSRLPKAQIAGATHFDDLQVMDGPVPDNCILTFMFFENPAFEIGRFELGGAAEEETGRKLGQMIARSDDPKCMMTLVSGGPRG